MGEPYRILGSVPQVPIYVTGTITSAGGGAGGSTFVQLTGSSGIFEQTYGSGTLGSANELLRYETNFTSLLGLETTGSILSGAGRIYEVVVVNRTTGTLFAQIFDLTGGPGSAQIPFLSLPVLSASEKGFSWRLGRPVSLGIQMGWSSGYGQFTASANAGAFYVEYRK